MIKKQIKIKNAQDEFFEVPVELIVKKSTYCQGVIGCSFKIKNVKDHFGHISTSGDLTLIIASRKSKILKSYITNEIPYEKYQE